mmetsp:Transcript_54696/g.151731  ORF Transcript_54696/g.151731 Transcript_54696/m.151731 type:complete len:460 (-) Transcript_54696:94-1473(-)
MPRVPVGQAVSSFRPRGGPAGQPLPPGPVTPSVSAAMRANRGTIVTRHRRGVVIDVSNKRLDDNNFAEALQGAVAPTRALRDRELKEWVFFAKVNASNNKLTAVGVRHLLRFLEVLDLRLWSLRLDHNYIEDDGMALLVHLIQNSGLPMEDLHCSHNRVTAKGARLLLSALSTHGAYPRMGSDGNFVPLWLRLEHNLIEDPVGLVSEAQNHGCSICHVRPQGATRRCGMLNCCGCTFSSDTTPKVHLCYFTEQDSPSARGRAPAAKHPQARAQEYDFFVAEDDSDREYRHDPRSLTYAMTIQPRPMHTRRKYGKSRFRTTLKDQDAIDIQLGMALSLSLAEAEELPAEREAALRDDSEAEEQPVKREAQPWNDSEVEEQAGVAELGLQEDPPEPSKQAPVCELEPAENPVEPSAQERPPRALVQGVPPPPVPPPPPPAALPSKAMESVRKKNKIPQRRR